MGRGELPFCMRSTNFCSASSDLRDGRADATLSKLRLDFDAFLAYEDAYEDSWSKDTFEKGLESIQPVAAVEVAVILMEVCDEDGTMRSSLMEGIDSLAIVTEMRNRV